MGLLIQPYQDAQHLKLARRFGMSGSKTSETMLSMPCNKQTLKGKRNDAQ